MNDLPFEKQLAHAIFCQQLQSLDIDLHLLYLGQQAMFTTLTKQDSSI